MENEITIKDLINKLIKFKFKFIITFAILAFVSFICVFFVTIKTKKITTQFEFNWENYDDDKYPNNDSKYYLDVISSDNLLLSSKDLDISSDVLNFYKNEILKVELVPKSTMKIINGELEEIVDFSEIKLELNLSKSNVAEEVGEQFLRNLINNYKSYIVEEKSIAKFENLLSSLDNDQLDYYEQYEILLNELKLITYELNSNSKAYYTNRELYYKANSLLNDLTSNINTKLVENFYSIEDDYSDFKNKIEYSYKLALTDLEKANEQYVASQIIVDNLLGGQNSFMNVSYLQEMLEASLNLKEKLVEKQLAIELYEKLHNNIFGDDNTPEETDICGSDSETENCKFKVATDEFEKEFTELKESVHLLTEEFEIFANEYANENIQIRYTIPKEFELDQLLSLPILLIAGVVGSFGISALGVLIICDWNKEKEDN